MDDPGAWDDLPSIAEQVGLTLRLRRRALRLSQRGYAQLAGLTKSTLARLETAAGRLALDDVAAALEGAGYQLLVVDSISLAEGELVVPTWIPTDLTARTRGGSRFPAPRLVRPSEGGPTWWWLDEFLRKRRPCGPPPRWTTKRERPRVLRKQPAYEYGPRPRPEPE